MMKNLIRNYVYLPMVERLPVIRRVKVALFYQPDPVLPASEVVEITDNISPIIETSSAASINYQHGVLARILPLAHVGEFEEFIEKSPIHVADATITLLNLICSNLPDLSPAEWQNLLIAFRLASEHHPRALSHLSDYLMRAPAEPPKEGKDNSEKEIAARVSRARQLVSDALSEPASAPLACIFVCGKFRSFIDELDALIAPKADDEKISAFIYAMQ